MPIDVQGSHLQTQCLSFVGKESRGGQGKWPSIDSKLNT